MASAVVLVKAEMGSAVQVASALRKISGVAKAQAVAGPYDVIVTAEGKTVEELGEFVIAKIQQTKGVKDTLTCFVVG